MLRSSPSRSAARVKTRGSHGCEVAVKAVTVTSNSDTSPGGSNEHHRSPQRERHQPTRAPARLSSSSRPSSSRSRMSTARRSSTASLGWRLDADFAFDNGFRVVQFTPPGSGCSVQFGTNITSAAPGSAQGLYLVVSDIEAARDELAARGVEVSEVFHPGSRALSSSPTARAAASAGRRRITPATAPSPRSATRTATAGCCRRSPRGCPAASTPLRRRTPR